MSRVHLQLLVVCAAALAWSCGLQDECDSTYDPNCAGARQTSTPDGTGEAPRPLRYVSIDHRTEPDEEVRVDAIAIVRGDRMFFAAAVEATNLDDTDAILGAPGGLAEGAAPDTLDCSDPSQGLVIDGDGVVVSFPQQMPLWSTDEIIVYACGAGGWRVAIGDRIGGDFRDIGTVSFGSARFPVSESGGSTEDPP